MNNINIKYSEKSILKTPQTRKSIFTTISTKKVGAYHLHHH